MEYGPTFTRNLACGVTLNACRIPLSLIVSGSILTTTSLMSALGHVWTAPSWQGFSSRVQHWSVQPWPPIRKGSKFRENERLIPREFPDQNWVRFLITRRGGRLLLATIALSF
jgi:hypothetical protein